MKPLPSSFVPVDQRHFPKTMPGSDWYECIICRKLLKTAAETAQRCEARLTHKDTFTQAEEARNAVRKA